MFSCEFAIFAFEIVSSAPVLGSISLLCSLFDLGSSARLVHLVYSNSIILISELLSLVSILYGMLSM